jgi:hypothetical protein
MKSLTDFTYVAWQWACGYCLIREKYFVTTLEHCIDLSQQRSSMTVETRCMYSVCSLLILVTECYIK